MMSILNYARRAAKLCTLMPRAPIYLLSLHRLLTDAVELQHNLNSYKGNINLISGDCIRWLDTQANLSGHGTSSRISEKKEAIYKRLETCGTKRRVAFQAHNLAQDAGRKVRELKFNLGQLRHFIGRLDYTVADFVRKGEEYETAVIDFAQTAIDILPDDHPSYKLAQDIIARSSIEAPVRHNMGHPPYPDTGMAP